MGTLVKFYNAGGKLINLALIDLGSSTSGKQYAGSAVTRVIDALKQMKTDGQTPKLDMLLISHQDYDHWSLLPALQEKITDEISGFKMGDLYTSGSSWALNALKAI